MTQKIIKTSTGSMPDSFSYNVAFTNIDANFTELYAGAGGIPSSRAINTTAPLSGGGDLSADRTLTTSMSTNKLIGRGTAGTGVMEEITLGTNLTLSGTTLNVAGGGVSVANPGAQLVGLSAINGSAATAMRSDGAPALDQTIVPTWTGIHTFSLSEPRLKFNETDQGSDLKLWDIDVNAGVFTIRTRTDADGAGVDAFKIARGATTAIGTITFAGDIATVSGKALTATAATVGGIRFSCVGQTGTPPGVGIYSLASNTLNFSTASTGRGSFDANGNFISLQAVADQSKSVQVPTTGFSITIANNISTLILNPAGTLSSGTVTMPATPIDGQIIRIASSQIITALTISPNSGQTMADAFSTTLGAGSGKGYIYHLAGTVWFTLY